MKEVTQMKYVTGDYRKTVIVAVMATICILIAIVAGLSWGGRDVSQVIYLIMAVAAPTITALVTLATNERTGAKISTIEQNTNGNLTKLLTHVETQRVENAALAKALSDAGIAFPAPHQEETPDAT
jgi:hypothetical protein